MTMMKEKIRLLVMLAVMLAGSATAMAQEAVVNKQRHFPKSVPAGNYSGICWMGGDRYAVVDDKSPTAGFRPMTIVVDSLTGDILDVQADSLVTSHQPNRDEEGICYVAQTNTVFVSGERDGQIIEYSLDGQPTGRRLHTPEVFANTYDNRGFEALTYNAVTRRFWTTTENTLRSDGKRPKAGRNIVNRLRLQSFGDDLEPSHQYWYITDTLANSGAKSKCTLGVSGMAALDDGRIVVLEREVLRTASAIGSYAHVRLYMVDPKRHQPGDTLEKRLIAEFRTRINLTRRNFANYEGICAGPRLADGRQVLLLVADSQNQYKGILRDWFRSVVFDPTPTLPREGGKWKEER
jgi:hypothetical protein